MALALQICPIESQKVEGMSQDDKNPDTQNVSQNSHWFERIIQQSSILDVTSSVPRAAIKRSVTISIVALLLFLANNYAAGNLPCGADTCRWIKRHQWCSDTCNPSKGAAAQNNSAALYLTVDHFSNGMYVNLCSPFSCGLTLGHVFDEVT